ncbi:MAG: RidA family protein [Desulfobacterales bacterium]|nr:RidA family protein [Desulfobacterales bacterium]
MKTTYLQPSSLPVPAAPYVPGIRKGMFLFTSGQISVDGNGNVVGEGDIKAQTLQVLQNMKTILKEGGAKIADVVKTTVFIADINDFAAMNQVYTEFFGDCKPTRSTVQATLARPTLLVEIEAIAIVAE